MLHAAVVEDEEIFAHQLMEMLERYQKERGIRIGVTRFTDGDEIVEQYPKDLDLILMDIQMRFMDGMTAAEKIRLVDQNVVIMFITNRTDYAIRGYQVNAVDYVLKPISYPAFSQKMDRALERVGRHEGILLTLSTGNGVMKVDSGEIFYIESQGHTLVYHTKRGVFKVRGRIQDAEEALRGKSFFRSNKGYLVNLEYVSGVEDGCSVIGEERLPVSRARKSEFMQALVNYVGEM